MRRLASPCLSQRLAACIAACKPGAQVADICGLGDKTIEEEAAKFYNKKDRAATRSTRASPSHLRLCEQPGVPQLPGDEDTTVLEEGQAVKLDLGAHVDGYIAVVANTVVLMGDMNAPVTGVQADVMQAVVTAGEAAIRKLRPGQGTAEVGKAIERVAEDFGVNVLEGVLTHSMKRFVIDGNKVILNKPSPELRAEDETVELNEVYALDIVMSSGEGKPKIQDEKETAVYKRAIEKNYKLKMQASRAVFSEISTSSPPCPSPCAPWATFAATLGLVECMKHELLHEYPVLYEKPGDAVAHFKATVLVMKNGNDRITTWTSQPIQSTSSSPTRTSRRHSPLRSSPEKKTKK